MTSGRPEDFKARVFASSYGDAMVTRTRAQHLTAERSGPLLGDTYSDFVLMGFVLEGSVSTEQNRGRYTSTPDDLSLISNRHAFRSVITDAAEVVQIYVSYAALRDHGLPETGWEGRAWPLATTAVALKQVLTAITATSDLENPEQAASRLFVGRALEQMSIAVAYELLGRHAPASTVRDAHRLRVLAHIAARFTDPAVTAERLAEELGMSRRYLHLLFEGFQPSPAERLRGARLAHAADLLSAPLSTSPITRIARASGFAGADQLSRAFKRHYGCTPTEYRMRGLAAGDSSL